MASDVFVSYASPNLEEIRKLAQFLKGCGATVWFDKDSLLGGEDWRKVIRREIREAKVFLFCLSSQATDRRGFFYNEMRVALDAAADIPPSQLYFMPVRLNMCPIPDEIGRYHVIDLFEDGATSVLRRSIERGIGKDLIKVDSASESGSFFRPSNPISSAPELEGLSSFANALLKEILEDAHGDDYRGVSVMAMTGTQGAHLPYLWDNQIHGGLELAIGPIARTLEAIEELESRGVLKLVHRAKQLSQWALSHRYLHSNPQ